MRLFEIIQTPINKDHSLSYDVKHNVLKWKRKPSLHFDDQNGRVLSIPAKPPRLMLKMVNRIKHMRRRYLVQQEKVTKLRGLMYGGANAAQQQEIQQAQSELLQLQNQLSAEIQAADLDQTHKDKLHAMAMQHVKRAVN